MNRWFLKRTFQMLLTAFIVVHLTFVVIRLLPGGPMDYLRAQLQRGGTTMRPEEIQRLARNYINVNPNDPIHVQYIQYMESLLFEFDLGESFWYNEPVGSLLSSAIPWTVFLIGSALIVTFVIGIALGAVMAYFEGSRFDIGATLYSVISTSIPYYVVAIAFIFLFGYQLELFPTRGTYDDTTTPGLNVEFFIGVIHHAVLPFLSLVLTGLGGWALSMRGNSIQVLGEDYMRVARLRGLSSRRISMRYVGRNAILPMYTSLLIAIGSVFGGSVVLETIFVYRGVGYYMFQGIQARDYPLMMGAFTLIALAVLIGIYIADMTYGKIDPRATQGETSENY